MHFYATVVRLGLLSFFLFFYRLGQALVEIVSVETFDRSYTVGSISLSLFSLCFFRSSLPLDGLSGFRCFGRFVANYDWAKFRLDTI